MSAGLGASRSESLAPAALLAQPLVEVAQRIRRREVSPVALAEASLERLETRGRALNAVVRLTRDLALDQARTAEREINAGRWRGPLHGIPWGAKDLLATAGIPAEWGADPCAGQTFDRDATVVRKLREAGAVMVGKLAMVEFAGCLGYRFADASASGPGRNPWDATRWTGGSSSGSGAAVGGGLVSFALGTETWGSILCPSAFCGVTGLRPTYGLVSRAGGMVGAFSFDKIGPLARSAADCRAILGAIAGFDEDDSTSADRRVDLTPRRRSPRSLKVALIEPDWAKTKGAEPEVHAAFERALEDLRALGLDPQPAKLPDFPAAEVSGLLITAEALSTFEHFFANGGVKQLRDPYAEHQRDINAAIRGDDVVKAWRMRRVLQEKMVEWFRAWDVIVSPNFLSVAPPIATDLYESLPYGDSLGAVAVACGLPGLALPMGFGKSGMPCSFQIVGAPFDEALLCDLGELYQGRTKHHLASPKAA